MHLLHYMYIYTSECILLFMIEKVVILEEISCQPDKRYKVEEITCRAKIDFDLLSDDLKEQPMYNAISSVHEHFRRLIELSTKKLLTI